MWKGILCGRTLWAFRVQDKPNLDNILKSYLDYHDLQNLCNSPNYFERLRKKLFIMIKQLGLPTFFVIFTFVERLWDLFIKALHTLYVSRLNLSNKIEDLQSFHIIENMKRPYHMCKILRS
jgi:hypothetical protein